MVRGYQSAAIPVALLHRDLVAECRDELVACGRREPAKLDRRAIAADCADPKRLLIGKNAGKSVKVGKSFVVVVGIANSGYRLTGFIRGEIKWTGSHDVLLEPTGIFVED